MRSVPSFAPASIKRKLIATLLSLGVAGSVMAAGRSKKVNGTYLATAYSVSGITASGESTHRHVVAADPALLPIGSRIKIRRAGKYSGEYVVADTGEKIVGRRLDIYMPRPAECRKFGKRAVRVPPKATIPLPSKQSSLQQKKKWLTRMPGQPVKLSWRRSLR